MHFLGMGELLCLQGFLSRLGMIQPGAIKSSDFFQFRRQFCPLFFQIILGLNIYPEFRARTKKPGKAQGRIYGYRPLLPDNYLILVWSIKIPLANCKALIFMSIRKSSCRISPAGKQKKVKRPLTVDGILIEDYLEENADAVFWHQVEQWDKIK